MLPIVVRYHRTAEGAEHTTADQEDSLMDTQEIVKESEQRLRQENRRRRPSFAPIFQGGPA